MPPGLTLRAALAGLLAAGPAALAADPVPVPTISVGDIPDPAGGAPTIAPLAATEPTSVIDAAALQRYVAPTGNYDDALRLSPSVIDVAPNGPGLGEAQDVTIRGFADGQYDVTFDGIPFADSDDFTHHTSAYFMARDLARVVVDRGPGDATTIGDATFGGNVSLRSIAPAGDQVSISPAISLGTFDTALGSLLLDSGPNLLPGGARAVLDLEGEASRGSLDDVGQRRGDVFVRLDVPLGRHATLTIVSNLARTAENDPPGATKAEIAAFGPAVALDRDPSSQAYEGDNNSSYRTDITYAGLTALAGDWSISDKLYTYGLDRHFSFGLDPNGETPNRTALAPGDTPGQDARNGLRAFGDVLALARPLGRDLTLQTGLWIERQHNARSLDEVDVSADNQPNPILAPVPGVAGSAAVERDQAETLVTAQPYAQLVWQASVALRLTAGLKGAIFDRSIDAPVMEATRLPTVVSRLFAAPVPSLGAHLRLSNAWSAYAEAARGFLAPPLQFFDVSNPSTASIEPEATWNFQAGTVWRSRAGSISADLYQILFSNAVGNRTVGGQTIDFDAGSATYRGVELETTQSLAADWSLYGSASLNGGRQHGTGGGVSGPVPTTPQATLAGGLLYRRGALEASLLDRWVGGSYGDVGGTEWIDPDNQLDASAAITFHLVRASPIRLQAQLFNLLDSRSIDGLAGTTAANGTPLFWTQAGRSLFVTAAASF